MKALTLASLGVLTINLTVASATVTVTRVPTTGTAATVTPLGGDRYDVHLETTVTAQPTTFTISGATGDAIRNLSWTHRPRDEQQFYAFTVRRRDSPSSQ